MFRRIGLSIFCLLAALPLGAAPVPHPYQITEGTLEISFDSAQPSYLPLASFALPESLCTATPGPGGDETPLRPSAECVQAVQPPPRLGFFVDAASPDGGKVRVSVHPVDLPAWEGATQIATSCGRWSVSMRLDPDPEQPVSELALESSAEGIPYGVFAGVVRLAVLFRAENPEKGLTVELPAVIPLDLSGNWLAVPDGGPSLGDGASNLVLFAGVVAGTLSGDLGQAAWGGRRCSIHAGTPPSVLDTLNQSFHP